MRSRVARGERKKVLGAQEISGSRSPSGASIVTSRNATVSQSEPSTATLPILALRPTGDGTALARALARVLVRRALMQERALDTVEDCAIPT
jgi:hypothetical protein